MKVIYGISKVKRRIRNAVLAIGVFDGLHLGHQKLIRTAIKRAKKIHGKSIVMTFDPHPVHVLYPEVHLPLITTLPSRLRLLKEFGVDAVIVVAFTKEFSQLTPLEFIDGYLVKHVEPKEIFVGDDFRFGVDRSGTLKIFSEAGRKYGFEINSIHSAREEKGKISSTTIRELIADGNLQKAKKLLGRNVSISGAVIRGDGRGKLLGFPTANLNTQNEVLPPIGVYAVKVNIGRREINGMANIGYRPSFKNKDHQVSSEVHLFDFKKNLYGRDISIEFIRKIRDERIFNSTQKLIDQLCKDEIKARKILS